MTELIKPRYFTFRFPSELSISDYQIKKCIIDTSKRLNREVKDGKYPYIKSNDLIVKDIYLNCVRKNKDMFPEVFGYIYVDNIDFWIAVTSRGEDGLALKKEVEDTFWGDDEDDDVKMSVALPPLDFNEIKVGDESKSISICYVFKEIDYIERFENKIVSYKFGKKFFGELDTIKRELSRFSEHQDYPRVYIESQHDPSMAKLNIEFHPDEIGKACFVIDLVKFMPLVKKNNRKYTVKFSLLKKEQ